MEYEINLSMLWLVFKKCWIWIVILALLLGAGCGILAEYALDDKYSSSVTFYVVNLQEGVEYTQSAVITATQYLVKDYIELLKSDVIMEEIAIQLYEKYGMSFSTEELLRMISISASGTTSLFHVEVSSTNPRRAKEIAETIQEVVPAKLDAVTAKENTVDAVSFPKLDTRRDSPDVELYALIAAFFAAVLVYAIAFLKEMTSSKIYSEDDVAKVYKGPVLGAIPYCEHKKR